MIDVPYIGPFFSRQLGADGIHTVGDLLLHIAGTANIQEVFTSLSHLLRNARHGRAIDIRHSPILSNRRGGRMVNDVNPFAYNSIQALLQRARRLAPDDQRHNANRVASFALPFYDKLSLSAIHCGAHADNANACQRARRHCSWVPQTDATESHCVPRVRRTRSGPGAGRVSPAKRTQQPLVPGIGPIQVQGVYVGDPPWRRPR